MNKLFIIGNGFDLAHGMKTSYSDFFLWYLQKAVKRAHTDLSYMDDLITIPKQRILDAGRFNSFVEYKRLNIQIIPKTDLFNRLMRNTNSLNWVDIEYAYYENLYHLYNQYEKGFIDKNDAISSVVDLNKSLDLLKSELHEYLTTIDGNIEEPNFEIKEHLRLELDNEPFDSITKRYSDVMFLNFNYTSTIELYRDQFERYPIKVNHIHGQLNSSENPLIFGYGDEMDVNYGKIEHLNSNEFLKGFKSFGYHKTKNYQSLERFALFPFNAYIFGHSCGLSDRVLFNSVFENKNCNSIKIFYYQKNETENDFFEKTQEISRHFTLGNKGQTRTKIIPFPDCLPLQKYKK